MTFVPVAVSSVPVVLLPRRAPVRGLGRRVTAPVTLERREGRIRGVSRGADDAGARSSARREVPPDPLVDRFGRLHRDLRIAVTDRCNLRCAYCMAEGSVAFGDREDLLTVEEIVRVATVARGLGMTTVHLTGGEPLVRDDVVELVGRLATLGFDDIALTTNGTGLARLAGPLAAAGLHRVNVSCDSLRPRRFAGIRRGGELDQVLAGMEAAESAGLLPLKVNVVLIAGWNDDEIVDFAGFARDRGRVVRFIELLPLDAEGRWHRDLVVPGQRVVGEIAARWPLEPVAATGDPAAAERFRFADGGGEIGVVRSVTAPFCGRCDRLRLTAEGNLRNCLFSDDEVPLRPLLRQGGTDDDLRAAFGAAVARKQAGHGMDDPGFVRPARPMSMIGG